MQRVLIYDHADQPLFELSPLEVYGLDRKEAINGEHSLTIKTTHVLEKGQRVLTLDNRNRWREHVVYGTDEEHEKGSRPIGEYYCVWSLMHDLMGTTVSRMVGTQTPVLAEVALEAALSGTSRWGVGTVTQSTLSGASMYDMSGWDAMQVLVKTWGGEVDATIQVGLSGVVSRAVDLYDAQGEQEAKRRFDFGADIKGVRRKVPDGPMFCRISPRGKGEETESGGYGRKITIESVNDGKDWLQNNDMVPLVRVPDGNGGWEYPTRIVENSQIETPAELKAWGLSVLEEYTVPEVSYEVDAVQVAREGVDVQGVSLGDAVHVVDAKFNGLRVSARVVSVETDMLDELSVKVKLGYIGENIGTAFAKLQGDIASVNAAVDAIRQGTEMTDSYLQRLVARLNEEINATGGYWYLIEGLGTRTYDTAVSDPAVGAEASKVIEMRGGALRIADTKDAQGNWEFDTVFVSGHIASQLITAAQIESGYIGSPTSGNYINFDTGEARLAATALIGGATAQDIIDGYEDTITDSGTEFATSNDPNVEPTGGWSSVSPSWAAGQYIWMRTYTTKATGTTYSDPVMVSGKDGVDGTSISILGSYNTLAELQAAHPTGSTGDGYIVAGDLYVWNGSAWEDVGQIQGPAGQNGTSVTVSSIQYGTSNSASTQPSSWSTTAPTSLTKGKWLWVKTNYSTGSTAVSKTYIGTDGEDGTSIYVTSSGKSGGVTTVHLSDGTTLIINDGEDGATGQRGPAGQDGEDSYVHFAWADTPDGSGSSFSTTDSAGKAYIGVYSDRNTADSQDNTKYSWSKIEGEAVASMIPEWYLSSSSQIATGGEWSENIPSYRSGWYYWERSKITWTDNRQPTYTTEVLSEGLNSANNTAARAKNTADANKAVLDVLNTQEGVFNKLTNNGALQGLYMSNGQLYINGTYIKTGYLGSPDNRSYWNLDTGDIVIRKVLQESWGTLLAYMQMSFEEITITDSTGLVNGITDEQTAQALTLFAKPNNSNQYSNLRLIPYMPNKRWNGTAYYDYEQSTILSNETIRVCANTSKTDGAVLNLDPMDTFIEVKHTWYGTNYDIKITFGSRYLTVSRNGTTVFNMEYMNLNNTKLEFQGPMYATAFRNLSDRRLKEHVADIDEKAADFIRSLKPSLFRFKGHKGTHAGFYAQDVEEVDPWGAFVTEDSDGNKTLDYDALIAPLVSYCQQLERRIEALEKEAK